MWLMGFSPIPFERVSPLRDPPRSPNVPEDPKELLGHVEVRAVFEYSWHPVVPMSLLFGLPVYHSIRLDHILRVDEEQVPTVFIIPAVPVRNRDFDGAVFSRPLFSHIAPAGSGAGPYGRLHP